MSKRAEYEKNTEEKLDLYNARVETLRAHAGDETKAEDLKRVEELAAAGAAVTAVLDQLKRTTGDEWDVVKAGLAKSEDAIEEALAAAETARQAREDRAAGRSSPVKAKA